jgi:hypothetical protein
MRRKIQMSDVPLRGSPNTHDMSSHRQVSNQNATGANGALPFLKASRSA